MTSSFATVFAAVARSALPALVCAAAFGSLAGAVTVQDYPAVRLTYRDLPLETSKGQSVLVDRVETVATDHCARRSDRALQPSRPGSYCVYGVRAELPRAMPEPVRRAYDLGRSRRDQMRIAASTRGPA